MAIDLRGHGDSITTNDMDLSADTLAKWVVYYLNLNFFSLYKFYFSDVAQIISKVYPENPPPMILVGHSMGGAISVHIAKNLLIPSLIGLTVIDVVEGTAMDALTSMQSFLRSRPTSFKTIQQAIEWR